MRSNNNMKWALAPLQPSLKMLFINLKGKLKIESAKFNFTFQGPCIVRLTESDPIPFR